MSASFFIGLILMSIEIAGIRVLAPYFGHSVYVSGSLIGIVLIAMSIGYYVGGILTKNSEYFFPRIIIASVLISLILLLGYKPLLDMMSGYGEVPGSLISSIILFAPIVFLLSTTTPLIVSSLSKKGGEGIAASKIFAASTAGSVIGVFLTTFVLIPGLGTRSVLFGCFIILLMMSFFLYSNNKWMLSLLLVLLCITFLFPDEKSRSLFYKESPYNQVEVFQSNSFNFLVLNNPKYVQSMYDPAKIFTYKYYDFFNLGPFFLNRSLYNKINILILGMGAGTSVHQLKYFFPNSVIDAVELDPVVIDVGKKFFGMDNLTNVRTFAADGRPFVKNTNQIYDIVEIDVVEGGPYHPFYMMTKEFFQELYKITPDEGVIMVNLVLFDTNSTEAKLFTDAVVKTIYSSFSSVYGIRMEGNLIIFATKRDLTSKELRSQLAIEAITNPNNHMKLLLKYASENIESIEEKGTIVFTDDLAPVEKFTHSFIT